MRLSSCSVLQVEPTWQLLLAKSFNFIKNSGNRAKIPCATGTWRKIGGKRQLTVVFLMNPQPDASVRKAQGEGRSTQNVFTISSRRDSGFAGRPARDGMRGARLAEQCAANSQLLASAATTQTAPSRAPLTGRP